MSETGEYGCRCCHLIVYALPYLRVLMLPRICRVSNMFQVQCRYFCRPAPEGGFSSVYKAAYKSLLTITLAW